MRILIAVFTAACTTSLCDEQHGHEDTVTRGVYVVQAAEPAVGCWHVQRRAYKAHLPSGSAL
jgi:hypothetical protein